MRSQAFPTGVLRDRASLAVSMTGSFVQQALSRPAQCIVEMVEQFSHPCKALQVFAVGTLPKYLACSRLLRQASQGDAVTSHLLKRVRSFPGPLLQRCQRHLGVAGKKLAERTAQEAGKDYRGNDVDTEAEVGRVPEEVVELGCKAGFRQ